MKRFLLVGVVLVAVIGLAVLGWQATVSETKASPVQSSASGSIAERSDDLVGESMSQPDRSDASKRTDVKRTEQPPESKPQRKDSVQVHGRIVTSDQQPAVNLQLAVHQLPGTVLGADLRSVLERSPAEAITTDADGRFSFRIPCQTSAAVRVASREYVFSDGADRSTRTVEVADTNRDVGTWQLIAAARVSGVVTNEQSNPVEGVRVEAHRSNRIALGGSIANAVSDATGRFELRGLPADEYQIVTVSSEYVPANAPVSLTAGQHYTGLELKVLAGERITGVVKDDLGSPISAARVACVRKQQFGGQLQVETSRAEEAATTNFDGEFALGGIEDRSVRLVVTHPEHASVTKAFASDSRDVVITLQRLGKLAGVVVDADGRPMANSVVSWQLRAPGVLLRFNQQGATDAEGRFQLTGVTPGSVLLQARGSHVPVEQVIEVRPGAVIDGLRLEARVGATLDLTVVGPAGEGLADVEVSVRRAHEDGPARGFRVRRTRVGAFEADVERPGSTHRTDADGKARFVGLRQGRFELVCSHATATTSGSEIVEIPASGSMQHRLTMVPGGTVRIEVVDSRGQPAAAQPFVMQMIAAAEGTPGVERRASTNDKGFYLSGAWPIGKGKARLIESPRASSDGGFRVTVLQQDTGIVESEVAFEVRANLETTVKLTLPDRIDVFGVVRDASGPVAGVRIALQQEGRHFLPMLDSPSAESDPQGNYRIRAVLPGAYDLVYGRRGAVLPASVPVTLTTGTGEQRKDLLLPGGTIKLRVLSEVTGQPLAGVELSLERIATEGGGNQVRTVGVMLTLPAKNGGMTRMDYSSAGRAVTAKDGSAELRDIPAGRFELTLRASRHRRLHQRIEHDGTSVRDVGTLRLAAGGDIKVTLRHASGAPTVANIEIEGPGADGDTDVEIGFGTSHVFSGLAPGRYRLRASSPGPNQSYGPAAEVTVETGKTGSVALDVGGASR